MSEDKTEKSTLDLTLERFSKTRSSISKDIQESVQKMSSFKNLKEVQVSMLSLRQRLLEENHTLLENVTRVRKTLRKARGQHLEHLSNKVQTRYQYNEKTVLIEASTAETKELLDVFENQMAFFVDSIKTVDNVLFGIKTRVEIEKTLGI